MAHHLSLEGDTRTANGVRDAKLEKLGKLDDQSRLAFADFLEEVNASEMWDNFVLFHKPSIDDALDEKHLPEVPLLRFKEGRGCLSNDLSFRPCSLWFLNELLDHLCSLKSCYMINYLDISQYEVLTRLKEIKNEYTRLRNNPRLLTNISPTARGEFLKLVRIHLEEFRNVVQALQRYRMFLSGSVEKFTELVEKKSRPNFAKEKTRQKLQPWIQFLSRGAPGAYGKMKNIDPSRIEDGGEVEWGQDWGFHDCYLQVIPSGGLKIFGRYAQELRFCYKAFNFLHPELPDQFRKKGGWNVDDPESRSDEFGVLFIEPIAGLELPQGQDFKRGSFVKSRGMGSEGLFELNIFLHFPGPRQYEHRVAEQQAHDVADFPCSVVLYGGFDDGLA